MQGQLADRWGRPGGGSPLRLPLRAVSDTVRGSGGEPSGIEITPGALQRAWQKGLFDGRAVFIDHAALWEYPSLDNLAGVTMENTRYIDARPPNDLQPGAGIFSLPSDLTSEGWEGVGGAVYGVIELFTASPHSPGSGVAALLDELLALGEAAPDVGLSLVFYPVWQTPQTPLSMSAANGEGSGGGAALPFAPSSTSATSRASTWSSSRQPAGR